MYEILTSGDFEKVIEALNFKTAKCTYLYIPTEDAYWDNSFAVWEFTESEFNILNAACDGNDDEWCKKFPGIWWRYAEGTNIDGHPGYEVRAFTFHNKPVKAWADVDGDHVIEEEDDDGQVVVEDLGYVYLNPMEYCISEIGASTPKNIDAVCTGLAKLNNMTLSEFFRKYMEH